MWELDDGGFAGVVLLKKSRHVVSITHATSLRYSPSPAALSPSKNYSGSWDSIHVFEANERGRSAHYKLTSTVMLQLVAKSAPGISRAPRLIADSTNSVDLSGSMTRQVRQC